MTSCCNARKLQSSRSCSSSKDACAEHALPEPPLVWFDDMIGRCYDYAVQAASAGRPIVGILCEYTPRELILAAGAVPVCLCGGSAKTIPIAEKQLPSNLCPLIKSTYGYHVQRSNPFLEMADLVVAETTCDGKKKMYELMAKSRPMVVLELPQKPDDPDALSHWVAELRKLKSTLEKRFHTRITPGKLRAAITLMNRERRLRRQLASLMKNDPPPLPGRRLLELKSSISGIPEDLEQYEAALKVLRKRKGDPELGSRVRVLLTGVPTVHGAERVVDLIEDHGGVIVCMDNCTGLKPILEDVDSDADDLLLAVAEKYLHLPCSVMTPNARRLKTLEKMARDFRPHCIIDLAWHACLTYDVESELVRQLARQKLRLPYLHIQTDYSPSDSARLSVRIEALFEMIQQRRKRS